MAKLLLWCHILGEDPPEPLEVEAEGTRSVYALKEAIKKTSAPDLDAFSAHRLNLFKVGIPINKLKEKVGGKQKGEDVEGAELLHVSDKLKDVFEEGPADNQVQIIVVRPTGILQRATTPKNRSTSPSSRPTPRKSESETQALVDNLLSRHDTTLEEYLAGPPWNSFWEPPPSGDPETDRFISDLKIPEISREPILLLHDLGNGVVKQSVLDELFNGKSRLLVNTSGSGKTRLLLEGLSRGWGFYFTNAVETAVNPLGSRDVMDAINHYIPSSAGFIAEPEMIKDEHSRDVAYSRNHTIAIRRMHQVLVARILVFEHFLKKAKALHPARSIDEFKKHWLFLQLRSIDILGVDVFAALSEELSGASDKYLMIRHLKVHSKLLALQGEFGLSRDFVIVLDEAQVAIETLNGTFRSERDKSAKHPVLRPIVSACTAASEFPVILSGTSLPLEIVNDVACSAVMKASRFTLATNTGAFDDRERQRNYIMRYMPKHIAESESGRALLGRAWNWVRGRHRFTASLVDQLLGSSFQSPHRTLSAYVEMFCKFRPTDGQPFVDEERADVALLPSSKLSLDFSQILNDPGRLSLFSDVLYTWLIQRKHLRLTENKEKLVQYGFARFPDGRGEWALVDEPLVLCAAAQEFRNISDFSFEEHIKKGLLHEEGRGQCFEQTVGLYLASAFDDGRNLCDVFDFGESVPEWARQGAEIVSVIRDGETTSVHRFHLPGRMGATSVIGRKCSDVESTLEWFKNPSTLICFPDVQMGPDVGLFARLDCGLIVAIVVQIKWRSERILSKPVQLHAVSTVDPSQFYTHQNLKDKKYGNARERILESFRSLNELSPDIETNGWFKDGLPVLKVIAAYPAAVREDQLGQCVSLDMDRCLTVFDKKHVLEAVALSLGIAAGPKRGAEDDSIDTRPKKRSLPMAFP